MDSERHGMVRERAHVEDHCGATCDARGFEGDIPASMISKHLSNAITNVISQKEEKLSAPDRPGTP